MIWTAVLLAAALAGDARDEICTAAGWCWERPLPQGNTIGGAWGSGPRDLWLVGASGTILHFGGKWRAVTSPTEADLRDVWGSGANDVWAVGDRGTVLRWDGARWSAAAAGTTENLRAIWGSGKSDVWAVGDGGAIIRWDGTRWSTVNGGGSHTLLGVGGVGGVGGAGGVVWVAGARGALLRWEAGSLAPVPVDTDAALGRVIARAPNDVTVVTNRGPHLHFDGKGWSTVPRSVHDLFAAWDRWAIDRCGALYRTGEKPGGVSPVVETGANLNLVSNATGAVTHVGVRGLPGRLVGVEPRCTPPQLRLLQSVWFLGDGGGWSVGPDGAFLQRSGAAGWRLQPAPLEGDLSDVWASGPADAWVTGSKGIAHWDGRSWTVAGAEPLESVWGNAPDDVYAAGPMGLVRWFDGRRWTTIATDNGATLRGIWTVAGHIFAVGGDRGVEISSPGVALHWEGKRWSSFPLKQLLNGVWGSSATEVWAVGDRGTLLRFDGKRWKLVASPTTADLLSVAGTARDDVWAGGRDGALLRYDGSSWTAVKSGTSNHLIGLHAGPFGVAAVGTNGTVLVRRR